MSAHQGLSWGAHLSLSPSRRIPEFCRWLTLWPGYICLYINSQWVPVAPIIKSNSLVWFKGGAQFTFDYWTEWAQTMTLNSTCMKADIRKILGKIVDLSLATSVSERYTYQVAWLKTLLGSWTVFQRVCLWSCHACNKGCSHQLGVLPFNSILTPPTQR